MHVSEPNCRKRQENIRCAFVRSLKPPKSASGSKAEKKNYLADYLSFLIPYVKGNATSSNLNIPAEQDNCEDDNPPSVQSSELQGENDNYDSSHTSSFENPSERVPRSGRFPSPSQKNLLSPKTPPKIGLTPILKLKLPQQIGYIRKNVICVQRKKTQICCLLNHYCLI